VDVELSPAPEPRVAVAVREATACARVDIGDAPLLYVSAWRRAGLAAGVARRSPPLGALAAQHAGGDTGIVEPGDPRQDDRDQERPPGHAVAPRAAGGKSSDADRDCL